MIDGNTFSEAVVGKLAEIFGDKLVELEDNMEPDSDEEDDDDDDDESEFSDYEDADADLTEESGDDQGLAALIEKTTI